MSLSPSTKLGWFKNHSDKSPRTIELGRFIEMIREPDRHTQRTVADSKRAYVGAGGGKAGKAAAKPFKATLQCVMISATGSRKSPWTYSGLINVDFDELGGGICEIREKVIADPHIAFVFTSPSGDGLKAAMRVPVLSGGQEEDMRAQHRRHFRAMQNYCQKTFGHSPDFSTCDLLRLCYVSDDPRCTLNPDAKELDVDAWLPADEAPPDHQSDVPENTKGDPQEIVPIQIVEGLLDSIPSSPPYGIWLKISAAVRNSIGSDDKAIDTLTLWSSEQVTGEYEKLLKSSAFSQIGFGTLHWHARKNGYTGVIKRFFYAGKDGFAMQSKKQFIPLPQEGAVRQHLRQYRISKDDMDEVLCHIREEQLVKHIGPIAGHQPGLHEYNGDLFLVTVGPKLVVPSNGDSSFIRDIFASLLGNDGNHEQLERFFDWLAHCVRAVRSGKRAQTPVMALVGSIGDGKSLAIEIITHCLGGRAQNAYRFLSGGDMFNGELAGAELLTVDDDAVSKDYRARAHMTQAIKSNFFSGSVRVRGMHRGGFSCKPVQALVIATNADPEHVRLLPEIDQTMKDKIFLMKTTPANLPPGLAGHREEIAKRIDEALPGFLAFILARDLSQSRDNRGRLKCFWHPDITSALGLLSPERQLFELIHQLPEIISAISKGQVWQGTAASLTTELTATHSPVFRAALPLLGNWAGSCGVYLSRLSEDKNTGITKGPLDSKTKIQTYRIGKVPDRGGGKSGNISDPSGGE